jgi:hypothetical protein
MGLGESLASAFEGFIKDKLGVLADFLADWIVLVAEITYRVPRPDFSGGITAVLSKPNGLWGTIHEYHFGTGFPIGVTLLVVMWFARTGGVAMGVTSPEKATQAI